MMEEDYAVIENGTVINVIVWDGKGTLFLPEGQTVQRIGDSGAWIGWKFTTSFEPS